MGVGYILVNIDKREKISFFEIDTGTKLRELSGTIVASNMVTYYLLTHTGDHIGFINDTYPEMRLFGKTYKAEDFADFKEVTHRTVEEMIRQEILADMGKRWIDEADNLFVRDLVNKWDPRLS